MPRERLCSDSNCLGDCTWCNRATIEVPVVTGTPCVAERKCDSQCKGDCTWCNRAECEPEKTAEQRRVEQASAGGPSRRAAGA